MAAIWSALFVPMTDQSLVERACTPTLVRHGHQTTARCDDTVGGNSAGAA